MIPATARRTLAACAMAAAAWPAGASALGGDPLPRATPESVGVSSERLARIPAIVDAEIAAGRLPGAVLAIARRGKLVYYEAFGWRDKQSGARMTRDALFAIASMTKPIVATEAMMLDERGRMLVGDDVGKYLPPLASMRVAVPDASGQPSLQGVPARHPITIQDLMRHTAGVTYGNRGQSELFKSYPQSSNLSAETMTGSEFIAKLASLPLHYEPGTRWNYSLGFDVTGLAIEAVTGRRLGEQLAADVFAPLGMRDTAFHVPPEKVDRLAHVLPLNPETGKPQRIRDPVERPKFDCGGGCLVSSAADYLRFAQMLANGGELDGQRLLSRKSVEFMTSDQLGPEVDVAALRAYPNIDGYGFGMGVAVRRAAGVSPLLGSPGDYHWAGANGTYFTVDPKEQLVVVWMAQTPGNLRIHFRRLVNAMVYQALQ